MSIKGHSGCKLLLIENNGGSYIRKISADISYNIRLQMQCEKQSNFKHSQICTPEVFGNGYIDDLFYFDMEYINGLSFSDFIIKKSFKESNLIFDKLLSFIESNCLNTFVDPSGFITQKIEELSSKIIIDQNIIDFINEYKNIKIPNGYCHGDFTFENIIIHNNQIYLIDFLDSYIDSPIIDLSKIYQDLHLNWSNRMKNIDFLSSVRNLYFKNHLDSFVNSNVLFDVNSVRLQQILTILRILPYTRNMCLYTKLSCKISQLIKI